MPKKGRGRGVAARQAQLSRKKSRGKTRHQTFDAGPTESQSTRAATGPDATEGVQQEAVAVATVAPTPTPSRRRRQRVATEEAALTYRYLGTELRQIGIVAAFIGVLLAILTVVLGG